MPARSKTPRRSVGDDGGAARLAEARERAAREAQERAAAAAARARGDNVVAQTAAGKRRRSTVSEAAAPAAPPAQRKRARRVPVTLNQDDDDDDSMPDAAAEAPEEADEQDALSNDHTHRSRDTQGDADDAEDVAYSGAHGRLSRRKSSSSAAAMAPAPRRRSTSRPRQAQPVPPVTVLAPRARMESASHDDRSAQVVPPHPENAEPPLHAQQPQVASTRPRAQHNVTADVADDAVYATPAAAHAPVRLAPRRASLYDDQQSPPAAARAAHTLDLHRLRFLLPTLCLLMLVAMTVPLLKRALMRSELEVAHDAALRMLRTERGAFLCGRNATTLPHATADTPVLQLVPMPALLQSMSHMNAHVNMSKLGDVAHVLVHDSSVTCFGNASLPELLQCASVDAYATRDAMCMVHHVVSLLFTMLGRVLLHVLQWLLSLVWDYPLQVILVSSVFATTAGCLLIYSQTRLAWELYEFALALVYEFTACGKELDSRHVQDAVLRYAEGQFVLGRWRAMREWKRILYRLVREKSVCTSMSADAANQPMQLLQWASPIPLKQTADKPNKEAKMLALASGLRGSGEQLLSPAHITAGKRLVY